MTAIIYFLIWACVIAGCAGVIIWAVQQMLAALGAPAPVSAMARVIIVLIALLLIVQRALPLIPGA